MPDSKVAAWLSRFDSELAISTGVLAEIAFGVSRLRLDHHPERLTKFLADTRQRFAEVAYPFDVDAALIYGRLMGEAVQRGHNPKTMDVIVAAIALRHDAPLATRNVKDFEGLGVKLVNPWEG